MALHNLWGLILVSGCGISSLAGNLIKSICLSPCRAVLINGNAGRGDKLREAFCVHSVL